jgi:hypothetical protein
MRCCSSASPCTSVMLGRSPAKRTSPLRRRSSRKRNGSSRTARSTRPVSSSPRAIGLIRARCTGLRALEASSIFGRSSPRPALERSMERGRIREAEEVRDLADRDLPVDEVAHGKLAADRVDEVLVRRAEGLELSLKRTRAHAELARSALDVGLAVRQGLGDRTARSFDQGIGLRERSRPSGGESAPSRWPGRRRRS